MAPATRSQRAQLASPLAATTKRRAGSRATSAEPSAEPAPAPAATQKAPPVVSVAVSNKRRLYPGSEADDDEWRKEMEENVEEEEEEADDDEARKEPPKKRSKLKDKEFRDKINLQKELRALPKYPSPPRHEIDYAAVQHNWEAFKRGQLQTPAQKKPEPQPEPPKTAPQPARGFLGRFIDAFSPFKRPTSSAKKPAVKDARLSDARIDLIQLQHHTRLQNQLNQELGQALQEEEKKAAAEAPQEQAEPEEYQADPDRFKRKRTANEITGLGPLNIISESPEPSPAKMQTPSRPQRTFNGLVPKTERKQRRSIKEARALFAARGMRRNSNDPPTPAPKIAIARTAPTTPHDKNNYQRIRRLQEIEQLKAQQKAMEEKLARLRAEQEAEEKSGPPKTKRVKLDHLKSIPHNRPGDAEGCFRFPEGDSDDEMEVDEDAELLDNPFGTTDEEKEESEKAQRIASPVKTSSPVKAGSPAKAPMNPFASLPAPNTVEKPAPKPTPRPMSSFKRAASPLKQVQSPPKKAVSPVKKVVDVIELGDENEDTQDNDQTSSAAASPEPARVFSEGSEDESDIDDEDWPELPPKKVGEPEPPQWWKDQALEIFNRGFAHWEKTGEVLMD